MYEIEGVLPAFSRRRAWVQGRVIALLVAIAVVMGIPDVHAQEVGVENVYLEPGRPAMAVYMLGDVGRPGKWRVNTDMRLFDLLAVALPVGTGSAGGGKAEVRVELYRVSGNTRTLAFQGSLSPLIVSEEASMPLEAGDVIRVETVVKRGLPLLEILQITTSVATLVLLVVNLVSQ